MIKTSLRAAALILAAAAANAQQNLLEPLDIDRFTVNNAAVRQVSKALGYSTAQRVSLHKIAQQFPDLAGQARNLERQFEAKHGFPAIKAEQFLEASIGFAKTQAHRSEIEDLALQNAAGLTRTDAVTYLDLVRSRIAGDMELDVRKTMLWLQYANQPWEEMREHSQRVTTAGHPKSMGVNLELKVPLSWKVDEGDRPHIVAKWTKQNGTSETMHSVLIRDLGEAFSNEEIREFAEDGGAAYLLPDDARLISDAYIEIDRMPGMMLDYDLQRQSLDATHFTRSRSIYLYVGDRMVLLGCAIFTQEPLSVLDSNKIATMEKTCAHIARSMVFPDQY